jgi:hypothetical protein
LSGATATFSFGALATIANPSRIPQLGFDMSTTEWYMYCMRLAVDRVKKLCAGRGLNLTALLREAKVSRNAYYTLSRKPSVLPKSIQFMAAGLGVKPSALLEEKELPSDEACLLIKQIDAIEHRFKIHDRDNVRHTLLLLREKPVDRLRRALIRAQRPHIH